MTVLLVAIFFVHFPYNVLCFPLCLGERCACECAVYKHWVFVPGNPPEPSNLGPDPEVQAQAGLHRRYLRDRHLCENGAPPFLLSCLFTVCMSASLGVRSSLGPVEGHFAFHASC